MVSHVLGRNTGHGEMETNWLEIGEAKTPSRASLRLPVHIVCFKEWTSRSPGGWKMDQNFLVILCSASWEFYSFSFGASIYSPTLIIPYCFSSSVFAFSGSCLSWCFPPSLHSHQTRANSSVYVGVWAEKKKFKSLHTLKQRKEHFIFPFMVKRWFFLPLHKIHLGVYRPVILTMTILCVSVCAN